MNDLYDADYYLRGKETGKSCYTDYRWLPELTVPMVKRMVEYLGIERRHTVLDFGCARGYVVKAFRQLGYRACGVDTSEWAIANCDPVVRSFVATYTPVLHADWVIAKDVLEHVTDLDETVALLMGAANVGVFAVVPLAGWDGAYVVSEYDKDVTHFHRLTLQAWAGKFMRPGWEVTASYRVPGIKDNYAQYERGNGFITARRLPCG